jgi:hypothetical protein
VLECSIGVVVYTCLKFVQPMLTLPIKHDTFSSFFERLLRTFFLSLDIVIERTFLCIFFAVRTENDHV